MTSLHLLIITNAILIITLQTICAKPTSVASVQPVMGPRQQVETLGPNNVSADELAYWKRLVSPTLESKYKPYKVYANLVDISKNHEGKVYNFDKLNSEDVQNLIDFKAANSESCSPTSLQEKKDNLEDGVYVTMPNIMNFLKHHMIRQENVCWKTFEVELISEILEIPKKRREVVTKLRQSFDGLHPKKSLIETIDMSSPDFTIALATFMSTYGRDYLEGYNWSASTDDEIVFNSIFKKLLYKPCRDVSDATERFIEYYDEMMNGISTRGFRVISRKAKQWLASGRICSALLQINANSKPSESDIYKSYLSFELSPQANIAKQSGANTNDAKPNVPRKQIPSYDDDDDEDDQYGGHNESDS